MSWHVDAMKRYFVNKLIRNLIADQLQQNGTKVHKLRLEGAALYAALRNKLVEEAKEVQAATNKQTLIEELADVVEVLQALCEFEHISWHDVENARLQKRQKSGGFEDGTFAHAVSVPEHSAQGIAYCEDKLSRSEITGINHVTLAVADLQESFAFYHDVLRLKCIYRWQEGAYFLAGDLWLCLSLDCKRGTLPSPCYTHIALSVLDYDFTECAARIMQSGAAIWKENRSEGKSLYFLDPNGHKLELHVGDWKSRLAHYGTTSKNNP